MRVVQKKNKIAINIRINIEVKQKIKMKAIHSFEIHKRYQ